MDIFARLEFLKKIHLFHGLSDAELQSIAEKVEEKTYSAGSVIFQQGTEAESFFLISSGKVRIVRQTQGKEEQLAILVNGDYFGEMALVSKRRRSATVIAMIDTTMVVLKRQDFEELYKSNTKLKPNLEVVIRSRLLARTLRFKWLRPDEVVYFLARKHPIILLQKLLLPLFSVAAMFVFLYVVSLIFSPVVVLYTAVIYLVLLVLWIAWLILDWGNDYYIVTNQRVVWLEKVIGIYDSRQESPLSTILSVGIETDQLGRILDYGNVIVRTFVGRVPFSHVTHPNQAARMIEEYWQRTKDFAMGAEKEEMKDAIRRRLGIPIPSKPMPAADQTAVPAPKRTLLITRLLGENRLKLRYEEGDNVIYRKHWFVLIAQTGIPALFILGIIGVFIARLIQLARSPESALIQVLPGGGFSVDTLAISLLIGIVPFIGWFLYELVDWSNDIFLVASDQIIDIDKKPFGTEERRAAPLENILGTEYERVGILGNIFNYGTVYILVGGTKLAFEDVIYPAMVQSDIDRRRMARKAKQDEARSATERERMAEWLATYHGNVEEFRREQEKAEKKPKSE